MSNRSFFKQFALFGFSLTLIALPMSAVSQTAVSIPKNKYKMQDDIELGRKASQQIERQFPILNDAQATRYVESVGARLVANIPQEFQQPAFNYRFKLVNARDINAFALPGGPMYVNRGMITAARNEGEMAGVMAHEIAHVALRHATAQATKHGSAGNVLGQLGLILGGAILGGQAGAQAGAMAAAVWQTKYSRDFESQADILGAQIMARAGYDPRDLANMFRTIGAQRDGSRAPEWLSSHPDPGNRYQKINQEAASLNVSPNPRKITPDFTRTQASLSRLAPARSLAQIERDAPNRGASTNPMAGGRYSNVGLPSTQTRAYKGGNSFRVEVPSNWREFSGQGDVTFAPDGAYGSDGITHGVMIGVIQPQGNGLQNATDAFVRNLLNSNGYLRERSGSTAAYVGPNRGYATALVGVSPVTRRNESVVVYTAGLRDRRIFYLITVSPDAEASRYDYTFQKILNSIQLN